MAEVFTLLVILLLVLGVAAGQAVYLRARAWRRRRRLGLAGDWTAEGHGAQRW